MWPVAVQSQMNLFQPSLQRPACRQGAEGQCGVVLGAQSRLTTSPLPCWPAISTSEGSSPPTISSDRHPTYPRCNRPAHTPAGRVTSGPTPPTYSAPPARIPSPLYSPRCPSTPTLPPASPIDTSTRWGRPSVNTPAVATVTRSTRSPRFTTRWSRPETSSTARYLRSQRSAWLYSSRPSGSVVLNWKERLRAASRGATLSAGRARNAAGVRKLTGGAVPRSSHRSKTMCPCEDSRSCSRIIRSRMSSSILSAL